MNSWGRRSTTSIARAESESVAEQKMKELATLGIGLVPVADDLALVREAARMKARHKMSYADCFAAALAKISNVQLVTGDEEFQQVEKEIGVLWLRWQKPPRRVHSGSALVGW